MNDMLGRGCGPSTRTTALPSAANGHGHTVVTEMYIGQGLKREAVDPRLTRALRGTELWYTTSSTHAYAMKRCSTDKGHINHTKQVESQKEH